MRACILFTVAALLILLVAASPTDPSIQLEYTENLDQFKDKKNINLRMEKLLSCWLYICDDVAKSKDFSFDRSYLPLLKQCMKKISRKDAVLKITELGGKNMQEVKPLASFLSIPQIQTTLDDSYQLTEFDQYLIDRIHTLEQQLREMTSKGNIKDQVEQEINKRQKYYLGFIPANAFSHAVILVSISLALMCCCTWCKFYRSRNEIYEQKKAKMAQQKQEKRQKRQIMKEKVARYTQQMERKIK